MAGNVLWAGAGRGRRAEGDLRSTWGAGALGIQSMRGRSLGTDRAAHLPICVRTELGWLELGKIDNRSQSSLPIGKGCSWENGCGKNRAWFSPVTLRPIFASYVRPVFARTLGVWSVSQLFHGPAPRSPLHRLAVRLRHSRLGVYRRNLSTNIFFTADSSGVNIRAYCWYYMPAVRQPPHTTGTVMPKFAKVDCPAERVETHATVD